MKKRIQSFSNDPVVYYLHKNRNFIRKLEPSRDEKTVSEKVEDFAEQVEDIFAKQRKDLFYAFMGIDPKNETLVALAPPFKDRHPRAKVKESAAHPVRPLSHFKPLHVGTPDTNQHSRS